jgi:MFS family permease
MSFAAGAAPPPSPWRPLREPIYRALWIAGLFSNLGTWFQNVGASWTMTTLTSSPAMVALVQAASSLPMFVLSLPAGALADVLDRRRVLLVAQAWMLFAALALGVLALAGAIAPWTLLLFTFLMAAGAALNGPAWQAVQPELVSREDLAAAITLASISFNIARALGPALAGWVLASLGPAVTFLVNAASFIGVWVVLYRWRRPVAEAVLPAERILGAMATGVRYVRHAPEVLAPIVRGSAFIVCGSALWAILPVIARVEVGRGPAGYGLLLGAMGLGAVAGAVVLPRLRSGSSTDGVVAAATLVFAAATAALGTLRSFPLLLLAMLLAGGAWLSLLSSLNVALQTVVPAWVRGRALAVYMVFFYAALAAGSALWGSVAEHYGTRAALLGAAAGMIAGLVATRHLRLRSGAGLNLAPSRQWPAPIVAHDPEPERGPVLVTVHYSIDPLRAADFGAALAEVRRIRLRDGALQWGLFADAAREGDYSEIFLVRSWAEYLLQRARATITDAEAVERARSFHLGPDRPAVTRLLAVPVRREEVP